MDGTKTTARRSKRAEKTARPSGPKSRPSYPLPPQEFAAFLRARPRVRPPHIARVGARSGRDFGDLCALLEEAANDKLAEEGARRSFVVDSVFRPGDPVPSERAMPVVDLVVVIGTSGTMNLEASDLSQAADASIQAALRRWPSDLRVTWLGIGGTYPATRFQTTLHDHLTTVGASEASIKHASRRDGSAAIEDVAGQFDWRPGAKRVVFFLGDEALHGGDPQSAEDVAAADEAIAVANEHRVTVFTYAGDGISASLDPATGVTAVDEYARVALATGGHAYSFDTSDLSEFRTILEEIVRASGGDPRRPVALPEIRPTFHLRWGDRPQDRIRTDDVKVLSLTAENRHTNVALRDITAYLMIMDEEGLPATLPDGEPSVEIKPYSMISFGDLAACGRGGDERSSATREVVLISRGAPPGRHFVYLAYRYKVEVDLAHGAVFELEVTGG